MQQNLSVSTIYLCTNHPKLMTRQWLEFIYIFQNSGYRSLQSDSSSHFLNELNTNSENKKDYMIKTQSLN